MILRVMDVYWGRTLQMEDFGGYDSDSARGG
jgi:hypothetical protein